MNLLIFNVDAMLNKCLILILIVNVISTLILGGDATFVINEKSTYFCTKSIIINIDTNVKQMFGTNIEVQWVSTLINVDTILCATRAADGTSQNGV